jgi:hypothetical protein
MQMDTPGSKIAPWLEKSISSLAIGPKSGENVEAAQIYIHTRLEHSRSNHNKIRQLCNFSLTLTSATLKSRSNPKPG